MIIRWSQVRTNGANYSDEAIIRASQTIYDIQTGTDVFNQIVSDTIDYSEIDNTI